MLWELLPRLVYLGNSPWEYCPKSLLGRYLEQPRSLRHTLSELIREGTLSQIHPALARSQTRWSDPAWRQKKNEKPYTQRILTWGQSSHSLQRSWTLVHTYTEKKDQCRRRAKCELRRHLSTGETTKSTFFKHWQGKCTAVLLDLGLGFCRSFFPQAVRQPNSSSMLFIHSFIWLIFCEYHTDYICKFVIQICVV